MGRPRRVLAKERESEKLRECALTSKSSVETLSFVPTDQERGVGGRHVPGRAGLGPSLQVVGKIGGEE